MGLTAIMKVQFAFQDHFSKIESFQNQRNISVQDPFSSVFPVRSQSILENFLQSETFLMTNSV